MSPPRCTVLWLHGGWLRFGCCQWYCWSMSCAVRCTDGCGWDGLCGVTEGWPAVCPEWRGRSRSWVGGARGCTNWNWPGGCANPSPVPSPTPLSGAKAHPYHTGKETGPVQPSRVRAETASGAEKGLPRGDRGTQVHHPDPSGPTTDPHPPCVWPLGTQVGPQAPSTSTDSGYPVT